MRWLPQSLFGRLLALLLAGLILAQALSAAILLYDRGQTAYRAIGGNVAERIAALVRLLDDMPQSERHRLTKALNIPLNRISLDMPWRDAGADDSGQIPC